MNTSNPTEISELYQILLDRIPDDGLDAIDQYARMDITQALMLAYEDEWLPEQSGPCGNTATPAGMAQQAKFIRANFMRHAFDEIFKAISENPNKSPIDIVEAYLSVVARRKTVQRKDWDRTAYEAQYQTASDLLDIFTNNTIL